MSFEKFALNPNNFSGIVRLFPLPNLVMFPHVIQPLHIFEPRYRELMEAALATDSLITMALLSPGADAYADAPSLEPMACLGRVISHERLPDGRFNLLLMGLGRVRLMEELPRETKFRQAKAELVVEQKEPEHAGTIHLRETLVRRLRQLMSHTLPSTKQLEQVLSNKVSLGTLTDIVGYSLDLPMDFKQQLLEELDVQRRTEILIEEIDDMAATLLPEGEELEDSEPASEDSDFPPRFSDN